MTRAAHLAGTQRNTFRTQGDLVIDGRRLRYHDITRIAPTTLPISLRILLENVLRFDDGSSRVGDQIAAVVNGADSPVDLYPSRVFLHDTNGVPTLVDLAAIRDGIAALDGDPAAVNPVISSELVVDHSIIADVHGTSDALVRNVELEYSRNGERYRFLRWGQQSLEKFAVVPPGTGIMHQVNLEYLARVVMTEDDWVLPDVCLGTDSHTTMVNGLGVLGWGIGGVEAEAAMLGQSISINVPPVVGVYLQGALPAGSTATDLVLTITERLRAYGVIGKFVEFAGPGVSSLPLADRATIANMSPEFGSTCALFPIDEETLRYLRLTGRPEHHVRLIEAYAKAQGLWHAADRELEFETTIELDLGEVVPVIAGPSRPEDRVPLYQAKQRFAAAIRDVTETRIPHTNTATIHFGDEDYDIADGAVAIAAITSCTNTSNPEVMVAAGLLARNAVRAGLRKKPWVKTTLSPGSRVVMDYYASAGLVGDLEALGFHLAGFGCMTCIGASGPLIDEVSRAVREGVTVVSVLSGNRNFEGRIQPEVAMNYLASPPLVIAYALAGTMDIDLAVDPLGHTPHGRPVFLADLWPDPAEVHDVISRNVSSEMFTNVYRDVFSGDQRWRDIDVAKSGLYLWDEASTYIRRPPYLEGMTLEPSPIADIRDARVLVKLGDLVTTDHISPAGAITSGTPAWDYLAARGVTRRDMNTYASRRGNHEVMMRGAFANVRLQNQMLPGTQGGRTRNFLDGGSETTIFDAASAYRQAMVPMVVVSGKDYGGGSSRDWAAKGPALLGVRAVIARSFERIHRSNLVAMGVIPVELDDAGPDDIAPTGAEKISITGLDVLNNGETPSEVTIHTNGNSYTARIRLDTPREADYIRHGGVMPYVLRGLLNNASSRGSSSEQR